MWTSLAETSFAPPYAVLEDAEELAVELDTPLIRLWSRLGLRSAVLEAGSRADTAAILFQDPLHLRLAGREQPADAKGRSSPCAKTMGI